MANIFQRAVRRVKREICRRQAGQAYRMLAKENLVIVPGTPTHTNLGDSAITFAQILFLKKCGIAEERIVEIGLHEYGTYADFIKRYLRKDAAIMHLGGGNMGSQWMNEETFHRRLLKIFPKNRQIIFPQTIHYLSDENGIREEKNSIGCYNGKPNLTMVAREECSYETMKRLYPDTEILLAPDIVLSSSMEDYGVVPTARCGAILCMRNDMEQSMDNEDRKAIAAALEKHGLACRWSDTHSETDVTKETRRDMIRSKMQEFAGAEIVVTDRLHGMVFSAITGTPCIVFSNYNHKVKGTYQWIRYLPYIRYAESVEEAIADIPQLLEMKNCRYDNGPLQPYYEKLAEAVRR